ncbi:MAG: hypothetical protein Q7Q73_19545 [Verrucomicrobiota bacterium JB024]|nr:hypothetical protein [Verrucomicrobiota bacterium JB024]
MEEHLKSLVALCENMGASPEQALTMARQLWKRSEQIACERNIKQVEAMDYLLRLMVRGRQGGVWTDPPPEKASTAPEPAKKQGKSQD